MGLALAMAGPPEPESRSVAPRSVAEGLFAELLLGSEAEGERRFEELCRERPELAAELRQMRREWLDFRGAARAGLPGPIAERGARPAGPDHAAPPAIAGFELRARIGRGGMGEVWEAVDRKLGRSVALKLLPAGWLDSEVARERFRREALAAGRLSHSALVAVFAAGEDSGRPWISQELVSGGRTLRDRIEELRRAGEIPADHERAVAALFAEIADALEVAHRSGVVHRDLKPQNILLTERGAPKVADFGLARLEGEASLSRTGEFLGTVLYASPEHVGGGGSGAVDAQSDVFCLGIALYECLTLERPFRGETMQEIARAIAELDPPEPRSLRPRVPRDLSVICMQALEKRPEARYASMQALALDLRRFLADEPIRARPPGRIELVRKWGRRHPVRATALALGVAALAGLSVAQWRTLRALEATRLAREGEARANTELEGKVEELRVSRDEARADRAVSDEVVRVLSDLFEAATPFELGRGEPTLRELVARGAETLRAGEPESPRARARLLSTLGVVLSSLGDWPGAAELLEEALALWGGLGLESQPEALEAREALANVRFNLGDHPGALELALPLVDAWHRGELAPEVAMQALSDAALIKGAAGELEAARALHEESLAVVEAQMGSDSLDAAYSRSTLTQLDYREGRYAEGLARVERDAELLRPLLAAGNSIALDNHNMRALMLQALGRPAEAEPLFAEALEASERVLGADHPRSLNLRLNLGTVFEGQGRFAEAEALYRRSLELALARFGPHVQESMAAKNNLGQVLMQMHRLDEAEPLLRELVADAEAARGADHAYTAEKRIGLAICLWHTGRHDEAIDLLESSLPALPAGTPVRERSERALADWRRAAAERPATAP